MAGLGDMVNKGKEAMKDEKTSDKVLDGADNAADKVTGDKFDKQTDSVRDQADKRFGQ